MALFRCYSDLARQDSSTSRDSIGKTRTMASGNYCETLSAIQRSDQKLRPFSTVTLVWRDKTTSSMSRDSIGNRRKTVSGNYYNTLRAIQWSDQKLWPFSPVIPVWLHKASSSTSKDSIGTTRKTASGNYNKKYKRDPTVRLKFMALFSCYSDLARQDSSTSRDSIGKTRTMASGNYCETLNAIQRSDQKLRPFSAVIPIWHDRTLQRVGIP
jgi:hypothetical protein